MTHRVLIVGGGFGVHAAPLSQALPTPWECPVDEMGRVIVEPDLTVPGRPQVFVIGDMAHVRFGVLPSHA